MKNKTAQKLISFQGVMEKLISDEGCPWDKAQTHDSLKRYLIEESYEVYEAIEEKDDVKLCEELGDVLLQVVFHSALAERDGRFTLADVIAGIEEKMLRRHPHVFADAVAEDAQAVEVNWEIIKKKEKSKQGIHTLMDVPKAMAPLYRAEKIQQRAARVGFDWPDLDGALSKHQEEMNEFLQALKENQASQIANELGDLFFTLVNIARKLNLDPVDVLQGSNDSFVRRFQAMEKDIALQGRKIADLNLEELEKYWQVQKDSE